MILNNIPLYSGNLIHSSFAYSILREDVLAIGNIIAFRAPMEVTDNLVDLEDALEKDYIYSDDAINFCMELPNVDMFGAVCFQRLFNTQIANILSEIIGKHIKMKGDDIMVQAEHNQGGIVQQQGKASVSIACVRNGAALIHTGINITAGNKAPAFAYSTKLTDDQANEFMNRVINTFYEITDNIFVATAKTI